MFPRKFASLVEAITCFFKPYDGKCILIDFVNFPHSLVLKCAVVGCPWEITLDIEGTEVNEIPIILISEKHEFKPRSGGAEVLHKHVKPLVISIEEKFLIYEAILTAYCFEVSQDKDLRKILEKPNLGAFYSVLKGAYHSGGIWGNRAVRVDTSSNNISNCQRLLHAYVYRYKPYPIAEVHNFSMSLLHSLPDRFLNLQICSLSQCVVVHDSCFSNCQKPVPCMHAASLRRTPEYDFYTVFGELITFIYLYREDLSEEQCLRVFNSALGISSTMNLKDTIQHSVSTHGYLWFKRRFREDGISFSVNESAAEFFRAFYSKFPGFPPALYKDVLQRFITGRQDINPFDYAVIASTVVEETKTNNICNFDGLNTSEKLIKMCCLRYFHVLESTPISTVELCQEFPASALILKTLGDSDTVSEEHFIRSLNLILMTDYKISTQFGKYLMKFDGCSRDMKLALYCRSIALDPKFAADQSVSNFSVALPSLTLPKADTTSAKKTAAMARNVVFEIYRNILPLTAADGAKLCPNSLKRLTFGSEARPVVLKGFASGWPLIRDFSQHLLNRENHLVGGKYGCYRVEKDLVQLDRRAEKLTLANFLANDDVHAIVAPSGEASPINSTGCSWTPELADLVPPMPENIEHLFESGQLIQRGTEFFLAKKSSFVNLHYDDNFILYVCVAGTRTWYIAHPCMAYFIDPYADKPNGSQIRGFTPDSLPPGVPFSSIELKEGDAIIVPANFWHLVYGSVNDVGLTCGMNYSWIRENPIEMKTLRNATERHISAATAKIEDSVAQGIEEVYWQTCLEVGSDIKKLLSKSSDLKMPLCKSQKRQREQLE